MSNRMMTKKIAFIGGGQMAEALIGGLLAGQVCVPELIWATDPLADRRDRLKSQFGIRASADSRHHRGVRHGGGVLLASGHADSGNGQRKPNFGSHSDAILFRQTVLIDVYVEPRSTNIFSAYWKVYCRTSTSCFLSCAASLASFPASSVISRTPKPKPIF